MPVIGTEIFGQVAQASVAQGQLHLDWAKSFARLQQAEEQFKAQQREADRRFKLMESRHKEELKLSNLKYQQAELQLQTMQQQAEQQQVAQQSLQKALPLVGQYYQGLMSQDEEARNKGIEGLTKVLVEAGPAAPLLGQQLRQALPMMDSNIINAVLAAQARGGAAGAVAGGKEFAEASERIAQQLDTKVFGFSFEEFRAVHKDKMSGLEKQKANLMGQLRLKVRSVEAKALVDQMAATDITSLEALIRQAQASQSPGAAEVAAEYTRILPAFVALAREAAEEDALFDRNTDLHALNNRISQATLRDAVQYTGNIIDLDVESFAVSAGAKLQKLLSDTAGSVISSTPYLALREIYQDAGKQARAKELREEVLRLVDEAVPDVPGSQYVKQALYEQVMLMKAHSDPPPTGASEADTDSTKTFLDETLPTTKEQQLRSALGAYDPATLFSR